MDEVFRALADPSRRRLLDSLHGQAGQTLRELCADLDMTRQAVSKHLAVLEEANLVTTVRRGREKLHYLNAAPISDIAGRWISRYHAHRAEALADLKKALEETPMDKPEFVYTTYISTTPERLWQALTDPAFTQRYWGTALHSDWAPGALMTWEEKGATVADAEQVVLEAEPYRRLSYTWHTFTPEWAQAQGIPEDLRAKLAGEPRTKVTFDIEQSGQLVKLTVIHDGFAPGSPLLQMVSGGWPAVISSLKTLLETGDALPASAAKPQPETASA